MLYFSNLFENVTKDIISNNFDGVKEEDSNEYSPSSKQLIKSSLNSKDSYIQTSSFDEDFRTGKPVFKHWSINPSYYPYVT